MSPWALRAAAIPTVLWAARCHGFSRWPRSAFLHGLFGGTGRAFIQTSVRDQMKEVENQSLQVK